MPILSDLIIFIFFLGNLVFKINAEINPAVPPPTIHTSFILDIIFTIFKITW